MLTNTAPRRILLGVMFLLLWVPAAVKLLAPLAQSVVAEMAGGDVAPGQRPCLSNHCDFIMFWSAGMMAAHGEADIVYDQDKLLAWEEAHVLPLARVPYLYPPTNFLVTAGFGVLPFEWAYLL